MRGRTLSTSEQELLDALLAKEEFNIKKFDAALRKIKAEKSNVVSEYRNEYFYDCTLLAIAIRNKHEVAVQPLIQAGAKADWSTIYYAVVNDLASCLNALLLEGSYNDDLHDYTIGIFLNLAIEQHCLNAVKKLIEIVLNNTDLNNAINYSENENTLLMKAILMNSFECLQLLIKAEADVNRINIHGETALMIAIKKGSIAYIKELINVKDIDFNMKNNHGETALDIAKKQPNSIEIVKLIEAEAQLKTSKNNWSFLNLFPFWTQHKTNDGYQVLPQTNKEKPIDIKKVA